MPDATHEATGWFEPLYAAAGREERTVPWDREAAHPLLIAWGARQSSALPSGQRAMVVGCGLGDDAEFIASLGYGATAFDVSPSAIEAAKARFPQTSVAYRVADLFALPAEWDHAFNLVVEIQTIQALPLSLRKQASDQVARLVAPGGTLLAIAAARPDHTAIPDGPPWPLSREEIDAIANDSIKVASIDLVPTPPERSAPSAQMWLAEFRATTG